MRVEDIEIHTGHVDFGYEVIRRLEAKTEAATALSRAPTMEDVNGRLRQMAASVGANAIVNVEYRSGVSITSWKSMKATGLAVRKASDELACPSCAETIKRAATRCRFCGAELGPPHATLTSAGQPQSADSRTAGATSEAADRSHDSSRSAGAGQPVLKSNDNPWWIVGVIVFVLFMIALLAGM